MEDLEREPRARKVIPAGMDVGEATLLLDLLAQLKARRFGRIAVTVSDGRLMDIELAERLDRKVRQRI